MSNKVKKGFTLIELLVVIAIIAILAAILFPVFAKAREKAYQTTCTSNQRQIAAGIAMYMQDHEENFPTYSSDVSWASNLGKYGEPGLYDCPKMEGKGTEGAPEYGMNINLMGNSMGNVDSPSDTVLLTDRSAYPKDLSYTLANFERDVVARHAGNLLLACVDGHVATEKIDPTQSTLSQLLSNGYIIFLGKTEVLSVPGPVTTPASGGSWTVANIGTLPAQATPMGTSFPAMQFEYNIAYTGTYYCWAVGFYNQNAPTTPTNGIYVATYWTVSQNYIGTDETIPNPPGTGTGPASYPSQFMPIQVLAKVASKPAKMVVTITDGCVVAEGFTSTGVSLGKTSVMTTYSYAGQNNISLFTRGLRDPSPGDSNSATVTNFKAYLL